MLADIEAFGEQSRQVAEATGAIALSYVEWAVAQMGKLVRCSDDERFLRAALALARGVPGGGSGEMEVREWVQRAMPLIHNATHELLVEGRRLEEALREEHAGGGAGKGAASGGGPPTGPASGVVTSVGGAHTLEVRGGSGGGAHTMEAAAPHEGFQPSAG